MVRSLVVVCFVLVCSGLFAQSLPLVPDSDGSQILDSGKNPGSPAGEPLDPIGLVRQPPVIPSATSSNIDFLGRLQLGDVADVIVSGNFAYIAAGESIGVVLVSDRNNPRLMGWYDFDSTVKGLEYNFGYLFVAAGSAGLFILDVSAPNAPSLAGSLVTTDATGLDYLNSTYLYLADGSAGLQIVDISDLFAPTIVGSYITSSGALEVVGQGDFAYVTAGAAGLVIVNTLDKFAPSLASTYNTPSSAYDLFVSGSTVFIADRNSGVQILDVTDNYAPAFLTSYNTPGSAYGLYVYSGIMYVADNTSGILVFDVSDPSAPFLTATYNTEGSARGIWADSDNIFVADMANGMPIFSLQNTGLPILGSENTFPVLNDVFYAGSYAYTAADSSDLVIYDVSNPAAPSVASSLPLSGTSLAVFVSGTLAYVGGTTGMSIVDVSDPGAPFLVGFTATSGYSYDIDVSGGYAYVAASNGGLDIVDVSAPGTPTVVGTFGGVSSAQGVFVAGIYAYVADYGGGLNIVDISVPATPVSVGVEATHPGAYDVFLVGTLAYLADTSGGLVIVDVTTPGSPSLLGSVTTGFNGAYSVEVVGSYAYLGTYDGAFVADVSTPSSPVRVSGNLEERIWGISVSGNFLYGAGFNSGGLNIYDISQPFPELHTAVEDSNYLSRANSARVVVENNLMAVSHGFYGADLIDISSLISPKPLSNIKPGDWVRGMHLVGDRLYLAADNSVGLAIYDVSDPSTPVFLGSYNTTSFAYDVQVVGDYAFVADRNAGMVVVNISNPAAPTLAGTYTGATYLQNLVVRNNIAYLLDRDLGLITLDVTTPSAPVFLNSLDTGGSSSNGMALAGDKVFLAQGNHLAVVNIANPASPSLEGYYFGSGNIQDVAVANDIAYVAEGIDGLRILDVSNIFTILEVGYFDSDDYAGYVTLQDGYAYLSDDDNGVYLLHFNGQCFDDYEPNEVLAEAWTISDGQLVDALICSGTDYDWYRIDASGGGDGTLFSEMHPPVGSDYDLFLYDASGSLVAASISSGNSSEDISQQITDGIYYLLVRGHDGSSFDADNFYTLYYFFTPDGGGTCSQTPDEEVYIPIVTLDVNSKPVLHIQDPNQPDAVTGYNIYRSTSPTGPWVLIGSDVVDMDEGTANIQYVDLTGDVGGPWFYEVAAYNGACSAEGPY